MAQEEKPLLSKLWPNKGIDWAIMIVMAIALLCGALFSGLVGGLLAWTTGQTDLAPGWKAVAGVIGYGSALLLGVFLGRKIDAKKRSNSLSKSSNDKMQENHER
jgi:membrane associated rhomboid family serine protease